MAPGSTSPSGSCSRPTSGFQGGGDCFVNSTNNVKVANGKLSLTTRKEAQPFTCKSPMATTPRDTPVGWSARISRFAQAYGRFEIRAKFPAAKVAGLQSALWLWPKDPTRFGSWPASGEIDIAEFYSLYPDRAIPYIHYNAAPSDGGGDEQLLHDHGPLGVPHLRGRVDASTRSRSSTTARRA